MTKLKDNIRFAKRILLFDYHCLFSTDSHKTSGKKIMSIFNEVLSLFGFSDCTDMDFLLSNTYLDKIDIVITSAITMSAVLYILQKYNSSLSTCLHKRIFYPIITKAFSVGGHLFHYLHDLFPNDENFHSNVEEKKLSISEFVSNNASRTTSETTSLQQENAQKHHILMSSFHRSMIVTDKCYPFMPTKSVALIFSKPLNQKCPELNIGFQNVVDVSFIADVYDGKSLNRLSLNQRNNMVYSENIDIDHYLDDDFLHAYREIRRSLSHVILLFPKIHLTVNNESRTSNSTSETIFHDGREKMVAKDEISTFVSVNLWAPILCHVDDRTKNLLYQMETTLAVHIVFDTFLLNLSRKDSWKIVNSHNCPLDEIVVCSSDHQHVGVDYNGNQRGSLFTMKRSFS